MEPIGKVVVLEDTDRDGVMDKRTVFADGLMLRGRSRCWIAASSSVSRRTSG